MKGLVQAYRALTDIYLNGDWIGEAVKKQGAALYENKGSYRLVHGVIEHEFLYEYRIARLAEKPPKSSVKILLKMGMYLLDFSDLPDYTAVNEIAETAKKVGKGGVCGFLNAVLRRYAAAEKNLNPVDPDESLSASANLPLWLVKRYRVEWGDEAAKRLTSPRTALSHIRPALSFGKKALGEILSNRGIDCKETAYGFYIGAVGEISDLLKEGKATVMSYGSAEVCAAVPHPAGKVLDLCAAPGGKTVFLAEKFGAPVISCDLYPHRVELIRAYAERMKVSTVLPTQADGRILREEWRNAFSVVLLDAPCSGFGSLSSQPDIVLHRTEKDLDAIVETQRELLAVAGAYVEKGGAIVYATCTDLPSEDGDVVRDFLASRGDYILEKEKYTDPEEGGGDRYYYAILRRK